MVSSWGRASLLGAEVCCWSPHAVETKRFPFRHRALIRYTGSATMRVYFKGAALTVALILVLLLIHMHFRSNDEATESGRRTRARMNADNRHLASGGAKGSGLQSAQMAASRGLRGRPPQSDSVQMRAAPRSRQTVNTGTLGAVNNANGVVRKRPSQNVARFEQVDITEVDPVAATEPQVIRRQEELNEAKRKLAPVGERPKPPQKVNMEVVKREETKPYVYPEWYSTSVVRSAVYGRESNFVGDQPLFGVCPNANKAPKRKTFSYVEPKTFLPNSKNPCWWEEPDKERMLRCLPYFYVAGVAKCGTTDLYRRLRYHPDVMWGTLKEYHWWDRLRYGASMELKFTEDGKTNDAPLPLKEYSRIITGEDINLITKELKEQGSSTRICGDGSPSYLWDNSQWDIFEGNQGCTEPRLVPGSFIKNAYPDAKIFLIFRHPTERLYSRFLSRIPRVPAFKNASPSMFHGFVQNAVKLYKDCFKRWSIRECAYNSSLYDDAIIRVQEGLYSVYVEDWLRIFHRDQIMVIRNEDYAEDVEGHMRRAFQFLAVAELNQTMLAPIIEHASVNVGKNYDTVGNMLPETIEILNEFYSPFINRLAELLKDERFLWKDIVVT